MTSSTLHSNQLGKGPKSVPALVIAATLLGFFLAVFYTLHLNPEVRFWLAVAEEQQAWLDAVRQEHGAVVAFAGGSTTAFAIDAQRLTEEHGIPAVNLAMHAGKGADLLVGYALTSLEPGDTLILAMEPALLGSRVDALPLGKQFAAARNQQEALTWGGRRASIIFPLNMLYALRPGGYHLITMIGKWILREPAYRYTVDDVRPGGMLVTAERRDFPVGPEVMEEASLPALSPYGRDLLRRLRNAATERGIEVVYLLPWAYVPPASAATMREAGERYVDAMEAWIPVLRESAFGVHDVRADFSDTRQHLTEDAAQTRTDAFAAYWQKFNIEKVTGLNE